MSRRTVLLSAAVLVAAATAAVRAGAGGPVEIDGVTEWARPVSIALAGAGATFEAFGPTFRPEQTAPPVELQALLKWSEPRWHEAAFPRGDVREIGVLTLTLLETTR